MAAAIPTELDPGLALLARGLYDPGGHVNGTYQAEFSEFVLGLYGTAEMSVGKTAIAIACDYVEYGYNPDKVLAQVASFDVADEAHEAIRRVERRAHRHASSIISLVRGTGLVPNSKLLVASADALARESYAGKFRRSGRPYYNHPMEAAAIGLDAFSSIIQDGYFVDPQRLDASLATFFLHDGAEETIKSCKFFGPRPQSFSPLLVRHMFDMLDNPYGQQVADSLRLMTHLDRDKMPWAPEYLEYIGACAGNFQYCVSKPPDIVHNRDTEPKQPKNPDDVQDRRKIADKRAEYDGALEKIGAAIVTASHTNDASPSDARWAPHYVGNVIRAGRPGNIPRLVGNLSLYVYGDERRIPVVPLPRAA